MTTDEPTQTSSIETANEAYTAIREYVAGIAESDMLEPQRVGKWSGKDLVVHLADWEQVGARMIAEAAQGKPDRWLTTDEDGDTYNERRVNELSEYSLEHALDFWENAHKQFVDAFRQHDSDRDDLLLGITRHHYQLHMPDFRHVKPFKPLEDDERAALLEEMDDAHRTFQTNIGSIGDEALLLPGTVGVWTGKDLVAHLGHWQQAAVELTRSLEAGEPGKWPGENGGNINQWNEERVAATADQTLSQVKQDQHERFEELRELISSSPFATRSAGIGATSFHYDMHAPDFDEIRNAG